MLKDNRAFYQKLVSKIKSMLMIYKEKER